jgi:hypothetical protein
MSHEAPRTELTSEFDMLSEGFREHFQPPPPDASMLALLHGLATSESSDSVLGPMKKK